MDLFAHYLIIYERYIYLVLRWARFISGDKVSVQIVGRDRLRRLKGQIEDVSERAHKKMAGRYLKDVVGGLGLVDQAQEHQVIRVPSERADDIKDGQVVIVDILQYPSKKSQLLAESSRL